MTETSGTTSTQAAKPSWKPLPYIALGVAMIIVDSTIVNVAIPSIIRDLGLTTTQAEWMNAIYSLVFASLLLITGRLGDRFGRRTMLLLGTVIFVLASVVAAVAPTTEMLLLGRFLQGLGGALILPSSLSTLNALYQGRDRQIAFGIWGATIGGAAALGPLLGGWLTEHLSWRWAFAINIPIGAIIIFGLLRFVPDTRDTHDRGGWDVLGAVLSALGLGLLVFGLIEGQNYGWVSLAEGAELTWWPWSTSPVIFALLGSAAVMGAFVLLQLRRSSAGKAVLVDPALFRIRSFSYGNITALIVSLGEFGLLFALPLFLQSVRGLGAMDTGLVLLALAAGSFVAGPTAGQLSGRIGARTVVRIGMALEIIGILGIGFVISPTVSAWAIVPWLFVYGLGVGFATAQITGVIMADVPIERSGQGSAVQSTFRQIGAALGTAILGAILVTSLRGESEDRLVASGLPEQAASELAQGIAKAPSQVIPSLPPEQVAIAGQAFADATKHVSWAAAAFIALGLLASLALPKEAAEPSSEAAESAS